MITQNRTMSAGFNRGMNRGGLPVSRMSTASLLRESSPSKKEEAREDEKEPGQKEETGKFSECMLYGDC